MAINFGVGDAALSHIYRCYECGHSVRSANPNCKYPGNHSKKMSINEIEKIINRDGGESVDMQMDGTVRIRPEDEIVVMKASAERDRQRMRDKRLDELTAENKRLKAALRAMTEA